MAIQQPVQPRAPLDSAPNNNTYRIHPPTRAGEPQDSSKELPVKSNAGLIAGLTLTFVSVLGLLFYYGL